MKEVIMQRHHYRIVVDQNGVHGMFNPAQLKDKQVTIWLEGERQIKVAPEMLLSQDDKYHLPITFPERRKSVPEHFRR
jgi:hypothetical protein